MTLHGAVSSPTMAMATRGHTIKYSVEHRLKDGAFERAMIDSLTNQFLPRALPVLKKHKILRYVVQNADQEAGAVLQAEVNQEHLNGKVNDCDVVLEYWVRDLESIKALSADPEWVQITHEYENDWFDTSKSVVRISYDMAYLDQDTLTDQFVRKGRRGRATATFD